MKLLGTGGRDWPEEQAELIDSTVTTILLGSNPPNKPPHHLTVGDCTTGADRILLDIWREWGHDYTVHVAEWEAPCKRTCTPRHRIYRRGVSVCPAAGPYRNQRMVETKPDIGVAFPTPHSKGTWDTVRRLVAARIPVIICHLDGKLEVR